ncbi:MAG: tetratricopeptide repeat protein [Spirochaetales bacterium]|nr:tetratricopeptide repeat protein [Spirochaetales bacterium]
MGQKQSTILLFGLLLLLGGVGLLASQYWNTSPESPAEVQEAYTSLREADEYLRQNSREAAENASAIFNRVLARNINPEINQLARYGLGVALEKMDDRAAALEYYEDLRREQIHDPALADRVDYSLGKLYLFISHEEEGRSLLEALLARTRDPELKSRIHTAYGMFYLSRGDGRRAKENFTIALEYYPSNLQARRGQARAARGQGGDWASFEYYDDYLVGRSNLEPETRQRVAEEVRRDAYNGGIRSYRSNEFTAAIPYFRRVIDGGGNDDLTEKATYWLAESYAGAGRTRDAIRCYDQVLANSNTEMDQAALIKKGIILFEGRQLEAAARSFQRAIDDYPSGGYTEKAIEWRRETMAQIREQSIMEDVEYRSEDRLYPDSDERASSER